MGLSYLPMTFARFAEGPLAGIAISTPVLIIVFRKVIRKEAKGRV